MSIKKVSFAVLGMLIVGVGALVLYRTVILPAPERTIINSETILSKLHSQGFLVSQTYVFNQKVVIERNSGSVWKDIFWKQKITASATFQVSSGIDLQKLSDQDVILQGTTILIFVPPLERQSTELIGDIILINNQGIFKKLFDHDDGYNLAYTRLKSEAEQAALTPKLRQEAEENAQNEIVKLLKLVDSSKEIKVEFEREEN